MTTSNLCHKTIAILSAKTVFDMIRTIEDTNDIKSDRASY